MGAPTTYTPEIASAICDRLASGFSVRSIADQPDMPASATIFSWLTKYPAFAEQYTRARESRAHARFESMDQVILDMRNGVIDAAQARVEIDTIKWQCGKEMPAKYGDQLKLEHSGTVGLSVAEILRQREERIINVTPELPPGETK